MEHPAVAEQLVGTWRLVAMRANMGDDMPEEPFGPDPLGYITYTADGYMHAIVTDRHRPRVGTPTEEFSRRTGLRRLAFLIRELPALARHTKATLKALAYAGTWEIRGPELIHRVSASVFPDWIGTEQRRVYAFDADQLVLTSHYPGDRYVEITWQRV